MVQFMEAAKRAIATQWFTSVSDTGMEVYFKLAYFNEWSHSAVGQSAYVIMPSFAKLIAIPFPFKK